MRIKLICSECRTEFSCEKGADHNNIIKDIEWHGITYDEARYMLRKVDVSDWKEAELLCYQCGKPSTATTSQKASAPTIWPYCEKKNRDHNAPRTIIIIDEQHPDIVYISCPLRDYGVKKQVSSHTTISTSDRPEQRL